MDDLKKDSEARHQRFLQRVLETQFVWGLQNAEGWCQAPSNHVEDGRVMPFWSDRALAAECALEEWGVYVPTPIPLADFLKDWLPGMTAAVMLAGTNWNADLVGMELPAELLSRELTGTVEVEQG